MHRCHAVPAADLELLRKYDTPTICNVVELFDLCPRTAGYLNGSIQACYPKLPPMVGYASTATFRSAAAPRHGNVYSGLDQQVAAFAELPGPPVVVFQDLDTPVMSATFGEIMEPGSAPSRRNGLRLSGMARPCPTIQLSQAARHHVTGLVNSALRTRAASATTAVGRSLTNIA